jgi:hypothetical protein
MTRLHSLALMVACLSAVPAMATEYTRFEPLAVTPAVRPGEPAGCTTTALLNLPQVWRVGDAAVVMLAPWQARDPARDHLVGAMLFEHAAVLELAIAPCPEAETTDATDPLPAALGALASLRRIAGAGMVVAIGYGPGARRMLDTVVEAEARTRLGERGPRFAAAAAFGDGPPAFVLGAAQQQRERAPERLALLCDALGGVAGELAEALGSTPAAATAAACRAVLAAPRLTRTIAIRD